MFHFMKDMCNTYAIIEEMESSDVNNMPTTSARYLLGPAKLNVCFPGLYGCTMVIVLSQYYLWMAHFIERRSAMEPHLWDFTVFKPLEFGAHGSNIPANKGLGLLGKARGVFGPDTNPQAFIVGPFERRGSLEDPQSTDWQYPEYSNKIEETLLRVIPHLKIQFAPYVANAAQFWAFDHIGDEAFHDDGYPYQTPYGKVLVTYDSNKHDAQKGDGCQIYAGYEVWVGDAAFTWGRDEWPALPVQMPDGWQTCQEISPGGYLPSPITTPKSSTVVRPSQSHSSTASTSDSSATTAPSSVEYAPLQSTWSTKPSGSTLMPRSTFLQSTSPIRLIPSIPTESILSSTELVIKAASVDTYLSLHGRSLPAAHTSGKEGRYPRNRGLLEPYRSWDSR